MKLDVAQLFTTRQVAQALGVSEASLKRWCDKGLIPFVRTPGGHRRLPLNGVFQFVRQQGQTLESPEALGLPPTLRRNAGSFTAIRERMQTAISGGDEPECRRLALHLYLDGHAVTDICDEILTPVFHQIGEEWEHGEREIYEERRAIEVCMRILHQLQSVLPVPEAGAPLAIGATLSGDPYVLPTTMVELVMRDAGWHAQSYGCGNPADTLASALQTIRPRLIWLSVSVIDDEDGFVREYGKLYTAATKADAAVLLGGRALTPKLRERIQYAAFCDNLKHAVAFARALYNPDATGEREASA